MISYEGDNDVGGTWGVCIWQKGYSPLAYCVNPTWYAGGLLLFKIERIDIPESEEKRQSQEKQNFKNTAENAYTG